METVDLACETREPRSKSRIHTMRRQGRVPAVLYGPGAQPVALTLNGAELRARVSSSGRQRLIRLRSDSPELNDKHVIVKEIQHGPVGGELLHADLYLVDLNKPLRVSVPLRFTGRAAGIAEGGILQPLVREVEVECLPLEIPEAIEVDVTPLKIHDVMHVSALIFAGTAKPIFDSDYPVVTVLPPTVEKVETPVAEVAVEGAAAEAGAAPAAGAPAEADGASGQKK
ncbi:MAG TPA: 50S ribosomal protein L25 [Candidatus Binataceae bacterium]|nr:50S ribosomal protein L25 [Candidatus Binataceae bacterium]